MTKLHDELTASVVKALHTIDPHVSEMFKNVVDEAAVLVVDAVFTTLEGSKEAHWAVAREMSRVFDRPTPPTMVKMYAPRVLEALAKEGKSH